MNNAEIEENAADFLIQLHTDLSGMWKTTKETNFYLFDFAANQSIALSKEYKLHESLGLPAPFDVNLLDPRQVLMIPLTEPNQRIFTLTNPESYGEADLFVFEIPD